MTELQKLIHVKQVLEVSNISGYITQLVPIPVAARSKAWVCGRSLTGIVGSNTTWGMDVCVVFVVRTVMGNVK
jgi:hypothetical protein